MLTTRGEYLRIRLELQVESMNAGSYKSSIFQPIVKVVEACSKQPRIIWRRPDFNALGLDSGYRGPTI